jgi:hypothetical protein
VEELLDFLFELGIEPVEGEKQVYAFNDAIITLEVDEFGNNILSVQLYDYVDVIDEDIAHIVDNAIMKDIDEEIRNEQGETWYEALGLDLEDEEPVLKPKTQAKQLVGGMLKDIVDQLLDEYNDKMSLYMTFGDSEYYERCQEILAELKKIKL